MAIFEYNRSTLKLDSTTKAAILVPHQLIEPYVGRFNYFKNYTFPILERYVKDINIDLVLISNFLFERYDTTLPKVFGKRTSTKFSLVVLHMLLQYDYITTFNSHALMHKNMPNLYDIVDYSYDVIVPERCFNPIENPEIYSLLDILYTLKHSAATPKYNKIKVYDYYRKNPQSWWSGPHIIFNLNMKIWFEPLRLLDFQMNDMIWHYVYHALQGHNLYRLKILPKLNMISMNTFIMEIAKRSPTPLQTLMHALRLFKKLSKLSLPLIFKSDTSIISYFGGCGSYSSAWKLRPLMMEYVLKLLTSFYY